MLVLPTLGLGCRATATRPPPAAGWSVRTSRPAPRLHPVHRVETSIPRHDMEIIFAPSQTTGPVPGFGGSAGSLENDDAAGLDGSVDGQALRRRLAVILAGATNPGLDAGADRQPFGLG